MCKKHHCSNMQGDSMGYHFGMISVPFTYDEAPQWLKDMCDPEPYTLPTFRAEQIKPWPKIERPPERFFSIIDEYRNLEEMEEDS